MIRSTGTKGRLRQAAKGEHKEHFGVAFDIISDREFGANGKSVMDVLMHQRFKLASEGDLPAIRAMLRVISANLKGRKETRECGEIIRGDFSNPDPEPRNADLAMVILGIAGFDDAALRGVGLEEDEFENWYVRGLRPNRIERWVVEFAAKEGFAGDADPLTIRQVAAAMIDEERSDVGLWDTFLDRIKARLMGVYGPGATKFKAGVSGNLKGRPRKYAPVYPYDDFLTEAVSVQMKGEARTMTRLDALLLKLAMMAPSNRQIADQVLKITMQQHEQGWHKVEETQEIIRD